MKVLPLALVVLALVLATLASIFAMTARGARVRAESVLMLTQSDNKRLSNELEAKQAQFAARERSAMELEETRQKLALADRKNNELSNNIAQARNLETLHVQNESLLNAEIAELKTKLAAAELVKTDLAKAKNHIDELEQTLALLHRKGVATLGIHSGLAASIQAVGPENAFVVINLGAKQGLARGQKLLVRRGTEIIATVLTSEVRDDLCVAQVDPKNFRTALHKGDSILLDN